MRPPVKFSAELDVQVPAEKLWPLVSDTDRLNRAIGNPAIEFETIPQEEGGSIRKADMKLGPIHLRWQEMPFEWVRHEGFSVERVYDSGPIERAVVNCTLAPMENGSTQIGVQGDLTPRHAAGAVIANILVRKAVQDLLAQVRQIESFEQGKAAYPFKRAPNRAALNEDALLSAAARIRHEVQRKILGRFLEFLKAAYDEDLILMRPFALADRWGENRMDVLKTFLAASHAGILAMKWVPICPHCRGTKGEVPTLRDLRAQGYCDACNVTFNLNFDEAVEVRFTIHPGIRATTDATYCSGGPANTLHILAQARVPSRATRTLSVAVEPGRYRLRSPHVKGFARIVWSADQNIPAPKISATPDAFVPNELLFSGDRIELEIRNEMGREILFAVEEDGWGDKAASAAVVTTLQDFRDLFDREVLSPDNDLAIRSLTLLFSDLEAATELYRKVGDAHAHALLRQYFEFLMETIREHDGGIVKTIGDAVMAVFISPRNAVAAGIAIQRRVEDFNRREKMIAPIRIKLGVHRGPVIAVNFNDMLDYFGLSVNLACFMENESHGDDVVLSEEIHQDPDVVRLLEEENLTGEYFEAKWSGSDEPQKIMRVEI